MPKQVKAVQQVAPRQLAPSPSLATQSGNPIAYFYLTIKGFEEIPQTFFYFQKSKLFVKD